VEDRLNIALFRVAGCLCSNLQVQGPLHSVTITSFIRAIVYEVTGALSKTAGSFYVTFFLPVKVK